jgi:hypothetical protein
MVGLDQDHLASIGFVLGLAARLGISGGVPLFNVSIFFVLFHSFKYQSAHHRGPGNGHGDPIALPAGRIELY